MTLEAGHLILPALRWHPEHGFDAEATAIAEALALGVGGFILFGGTADAVRRLTADLVDRAGRPLLLASDLERGAGQQVEGLTPFPPPLALASLGDPAVARWAGAVTAHEARGVGINWIFSPVADLDVLAENPIVQTRAFGDEPARVASFVRAWIEGCQAAGALACAKHYPGHGRTASDSHVDLPVVPDDAATLQTTDLIPFEAAVHSRVASFMTAHVAYPALDPSGAPATFSEPILRFLRDGLAFDGLVVTDALIMEGATMGRSEPEAAVDAVRAGVDLLLYPHDPRGVREALDQALGNGNLPEARVTEALTRYERALTQAAVRPAPVGPGPFPSVNALADALVERGIARGSAPRLTLPLEIVIVDDDLGGPYPPGPNDVVPTVLGPDMARRDSGGSRVVLVFAEPRAWKGRAGLSSASNEALAKALPGADLIVLFGHPRLAAALPISAPQVSAPQVSGPRASGPQVSTPRASASPASAPVLVAWHRQELMQQAVARWLRRVTLH